MGCGSDDHECKVGIKLFGATISVEMSSSSSSSSSSSKDANKKNNNNNNKKKKNMINHDNDDEEEDRKTRAEKIIACPRCKSMETKFCYFNNYNVNQPRHFCKGCQRYWTAGGALRNVPIGAGRRKAKPPFFQNFHFHQDTWHHLNPSSTATAAAQILKRRRAVCDN